MDLHEHVLKFFQNKGVTKYHLRVSPNNLQEVSFYHKNGLNVLNSELDGKVVRMKEIYRIIKLTCFSVIKIMIASNFLQFS
ncbi:hypothetical protein LAV79_09860 [Peribacillus butanolivorans]